MTEQYDLVLHAPRAITVQGEVAARLPIAAEGLPLSAISGLISRPIG